jgi:hypothetical protein
MNVHVAVSPFVDFDSYHEWRFGVDDTRNTFIGLLKELMTLEMFQTSSIWLLILCGGMLWRNSLRHCATSLKVAGSIPDVFIGIFFQPHYAFR